MSFVVWSADNSDDRAHWLRAWEEWREREVFAHPDYARLFETETERAVCAAWRDGANTILFPLLIRRVPGSNRSFDLATPYGYGGPFAWRSAGAVAPPAGFWPSYEEWARELGAVSEFVRFSLFPDSLLGFYPGEKRSPMPNVVRELDLSPGALWQDYDRKVRKNVNRARAGRVEIVYDPLGERLDEFLRIYRATMARRLAAASYDFPDAFFENVRTRLRNSHAFFHATLNGSVIASELVLTSASRAYSFLGGTDERHFPLRPNDLLKVGIIDWCRETGRHAFVLGGGHEPFDGIFRYKLAFAPSGQRMFQTGARILDTAAYSALVELRRRSDPHWQPRPDYFPAYRA